MRRFDSPPRPAKPAYSRVSYRVIPPFNHATITISLVSAATLTLYPPGHQPPTGHSSYYRTPS